MSKLIKNKKSPEYIKDINIKDQEIIKVYRYSDENNLQNDKEK